MILAMDNDTAWLIVVVGFVAVVALALPPRGHSTPPGSKASKVMGCIALAIVAAFVVGIWLFVRSK